MDGNEVLKKLKEQNVNVKVTEGLREDIEVFEKVPMELMGIDKKNRSILQYWLPRWILNAVENYPKKDPSHSIDSSATIKNWKDKYKGFAAVIIGAGATLDSVIDELRDIPALIFCPNSALKNLIANGVEPTFTCAFDCNDYIKKDFIGVETEGRVLLTSTSSHPNTIKAWNGIIKYFNLFHPRISFFEHTLFILYNRMIGIPNSGCVANNMIRIASYLGCSPLILAGVDFGFVGGKRRCRQYKKYKGKWVEVPVNHKFWRKDITEENGCKCLPEHQTYKKALLQIKNQVPDNEDNRIKILNATPGGILGNEFPIINLAEYKKKLTVPEEVKYRLGQIEDVGDAAFEYDEGRIKYAFKCIAEIPKGINKLLEVGCQNGYQTKYIADTVKQLIAIDLSQDNIWECNCRNLKAKAMTMDVQDMQIISGDADCVFANNILEHTDPKKSLKEIYRVLQPGGTLLAWIPWDKINYPEFQTERHLWKTDEKDCLEKMIQAGFEKEKIKISTWDVKPFGIFHAPSGGLMGFIKAIK